MYATMLPKIFLLDYKHQDKIEHETIKIAIVYDEKDYLNAKKLKNFMREKYKKGLRDYKINITLVSYKDTQNSKANIYYLFPSSANNIKKIVQRAFSDKALTFSYLSSDLQYGVMISLNVSKKVKPLLNIEAIHESGITFRPILINISTIYKSDLALKLKDTKYNGFNTSEVYEYC